MDKLKKNIDKLFNATLLKNCIQEKSRNNVAPRKASNGVLDYLIKLVTKSR